jgi:hypothetical protein
MSLAAILSTIVTIVPTVDGTEDRYGNPARTDATPIPNVPAKRNPLMAKTKEDELDREQETTLVLYVLALRSTDGVEVAIGAHDKIVDGGLTFEVFGPPNLVHRRKDPHHWETRAIRVEG